MRNKKIFVLPTTASSIGCSVKGILFFLRLLHESIVYRACKIAAVHILHRISSHDRVGMPTINIHAVAVR